MKVTDPVCGMTIESDKAAATERYQGQVYYFCSTGCCDTFKQNPAQYAERPAGAGHGGHGRGAGHRH